MAKSFPVNFRREYRQKTPLAAALNVDRAAASGLILQFSLLAGKSDAETGSI
jgi:hypothetical protein